MKAKIKRPPREMITGTLNSVFPAEWIERTARETGFVRRERKISPLIMLWSLVFSVGPTMQRTLSDMKRDYELGARTRLSDGSWFPRFTPELVGFLKACVMRAMETMGDDNRELSPKLARFRDVLIQDSTIVRLHASLAKKWPAVRTRKVAAGVKVSVLVSAVAAGPARIAIHGERTSEIKTLRLGPWIKDRILLADLGFYSHLSFEKIEEYGGYFGC